MNLNGSKRFGVHLDTTLKVIKQDLIKRFRENEIDLTPEQWTLLDELSTRGELTQKELAASTFKDPPTVSRIIDLLVKRDLIDRRQDEFDRRKFIVQLTPAGKDLFEKSAPIVLSARIEGWEGLSNDDYAQLKKVLDTIVTNIQKTKP